MTVAAKPIDAPLTQMGSLDVRVETITPAIAKRYLARNQNNRNIRPTVWAKYAGSMRRDDWSLNGDAIRFDVFGNLIDGQHRLIACVESGKPFVSLVIRGLSPKARDSIDVGAKRSLGDHLKEHGYVDVSTLSSVLTYLHRIETKQLRSVGQGYVPPAVDECLALIVQYPRVHDSIRLAGTMNKRLRIPRAQMAALHSWLSQLDSDDADAFMESLTTGLNLSAGSPIYALRSWFENTKSEKRVSRYVVHGVVVKAWNAFRSGEDMKIARFRPGIEQTPVPR